MEIDELLRAESGIAQRLRKLRRERDLTWEELAAKVGTTQAVIQKIENGKSKRPWNLAKIAVALQVNPVCCSGGSRESIN